MRERLSNKGRVLGALALAAAAVGAATTGQADARPVDKVVGEAGGQPVGAQLAAARAATARYHDVDVAVADGYVPVSDCVSSPDGAMGIHYMNPARAGAPLDVRKPAFLLYEPTRAGLRLVGVEYFQADADQDVSTDGDRPALLGEEFDGPMPGHGPGAPVHYDLHVWVWANNPSGMFAEYNPKVSC
ncbi:hypothetical protein [Marmoricola sp. RAF53]|uniref:hypothetical protein n=1 Tax=Marmoricola sp. RAF53 TaxID=3233059 RepID=UPI003F9CC6D4